MVDTGFVDDVRNVAEEMPPLRLNAGAFPDAVELRPWGRQAPLTELRFDKISFE